jgi:hypothetical protein
MKRLSIFALFVVMFFGCGEKPIVVKHKMDSLPKATQSVEKSILTPAILDKKVMPYSKRVYSFDKYSRFMYKKDCGDLLYRQRQLYKRNMKYDPISVLDITNELTKDIQKNGCR